MPENSIDPSCIISLLPAIHDTDYPLSIAFPKVHKSGWTPYDGKKVVGFPTMTIIDGKTIMRDGEITGRSNNQIEFNI